MTDAGLTLSSQAPVSVAADLEVGDRTVTDLWQTVIDRPGVRDAFVASVRDFARNKTAPELYDALADLDVPRWLYTRFEWVALGYRRAAWDLTVDVLPGLGQGRSSIEELLATAELFRVSDTGHRQTATVSVHITSAFEDLRRDQRVAVCRLLDRLGRGLDVRLVATGRMRLWLREHHREDLPGVSEWCSPPLSEGGTGARVDDALDALDWEGREVGLLRDLRDEAGETLSYHALYATYPEIDDSRVRQCVGQLVELGLVATFEGSSGTCVELLGAGRQTLDAIDAEIGRPTTLDDCVSERGQPVADSRVTTPAREAPPDGPAEPRRLGPVHRTTYMGRWEHAGAVGATADCDVALVDYPVRAAANRGDRRWSYDDAREELVVGAEYDNPCQYWVCVALALADRRTWDEVLTPERLASDDHDFAALFDEHRWLLRDARCLGDLPNRLQEPEEYIGLIEQWRDSLAELTRKLRHGEYDDRDRFRGAITRDALGLAGTVTHLLDLCGVDLVRTVSVPRLPDFDAGDIQDLARTISKGVAIGSKYREFAAYRSLFDPRDEKRTVPFPTVDAADPVGEVIGSFAIVGPNVSEKVGPALREWLAHPGEMQDDAPDFAVDVDIREAFGRQAYAAVLRHVRDAKSLRPTREAVTLLAGFAATPYDAAEALFDRLSPEDSAREIRVDEVRYALAGLGPGRHVPGLKPTVAKVLAALFRADEPLDREALADAAGVSTRSLRRYRDQLVALDVVRETPAGLRLAVSFHTDDERRRDILPRVVGDEWATVGDAIFEAAAHLLDDALRFGDPSDPVAQCWLSFPPDFDRLVDGWQWIEPWVPALRTLAGEPDPPPTTVTFGRRPAQASLQAAGGVA